MLRIRLAARSLAFAVPLFIGAGASACASTSPKPAFRDTAALIEARSGRRISWNQGGADDQVVERTVRGLIARELTVDAAIQIALLNNRNLVATYEELSIAQADLVQAGLLQNPVFSGGVAFPLTGPVRTGFDLSVSQDFLSVLSLAARKKVAAAELRATEARVGHAVLGLTFEVEQAFYNLTGAAQVAAMRRTIVEAGDAALDLARRQHEAGNINDLDLANEASLYEQVRTDLVRSNAEIVTAREALTRLLGLWGPDSGYQISDKLPELPEGEVDFERLESLAVGRRLDLAAARQEREVAARALSLAKSFRWVGSLNAGAVYESAPERYSTIGPNAGVELPIFDQKQAMIARLEARYRAAKAREAARAVEVRSEVRAARERVAAARLVVERYAKVVVPLRQRVVALTQEQYNAMLLGTYQLLQAKQGEVNAYRELIEALRDYWIARADLERATGGIVPGARAGGPTP